MVGEQPSRAPASVDDALAELEGRDAPARLHARDPSLWSDDPTTQAAIADRLGWLDAAVPQDERTERVRAVAADALAAGLDHAVLAGMGGSSLAPEVFAGVLAAGARATALTVLDSTHPRAVLDALEGPDPRRTLVIISSKSGTTEETAAFESRARRLLPGGDHLVAVTDPGTELDQRARSYRDCLCNPPDIGGRYSALSYFGMLPAALLGVDVAAVHARAAGMLGRCGPDGPAADNPAGVLAAWIAGHARVGQDKLTLLTHPALAPLGDWVEQLVAESLGKDGTGVVPVVGEPAGPPDAYGDDRAFVELRLAGQGAPGAAALADAGRAVLVLDMPQRLDLGAEFVRWEAATALAGALLGVNPFDEPNVAESKANTRAILDEVTAGGALAVPEEGDVQGLVNQVGAGDYLSLQAYLPPLDEAHEALRRMRVLVRDRLRVATTAGFGPRFLHSTGQLHKGGPDSVVALQVVDTTLWDGGDGVGIPDRGYDFATLLRAQAAGDLRSLREHGRRVSQVGVDGVAGLVGLVNVVDEATTPGRRRTRE
ncbi:MAG: glucose-6-phosphate isomerase [Actinobacteria bacterium]|nr:glucose-6-phosphate isomerase [Actinomycetota bacterium]